MTDEETGEETDETNDEVTDATMADAEELANSIADAVEGGADFAETVSGEIEDAEINQLENVFGATLDRVLASVRSFPAGCWTAPARRATSAS